MHAFIKGDGADFKIDRVPAHSSWIYQFSLQAVQTRNSSNDVMYFVYPGDKTQQCSKSVTRQLLLADFNCLPQDFFFASKINQSDYRKVFLVNQGQKLSYGISLDDYPNCCNQTTEDYFFANVSLPGKYCEMCVSNDHLETCLLRDIPRNSHMTYLAVLQTVKFYLCSIFILDPHNKSSVLGSI